MFSDILVGLMMPGVFGVGFLIGYYTARDNNRRY